MRDRPIRGDAGRRSARFKQIESLINKLREEERWRLKVTDVRNWFDFAAVETDDATDAERGYYDDSAGQSGGEKAKLAFTILSRRLPSSMISTRRGPTAIGSISLLSTRCSPA